MLLSLRLIQLRELLVWHHKTRTFGGLLGPCFKTGGMRSQNRTIQLRFEHRGVKQVRVKTTSEEAAAPALLLHTAAPELRW
jgi:hypothetical protein